MGKKERKDEAEEERNEEPPEEKKSRKSKKEKEKEKEEAPKKTSLGDSGTMKRMLDDAAIKVLLDSGGLAYEEDTGLSNVKLVVGFAGVGASLISHVYPATFPKNWWVLLACCAFYFICSGILQFLLSFVELESILLLKGKVGPDGKRGAGVNVSSHFPRYQEEYTLGISPLPSGSLGLAWAPKFQPLEAGKGNQLAHGQRLWRVSEFFDDEGVFYEELFCEAVHTFLQEFEALKSSKKVN